ncbi:ATP-dependent nuclease [Umezawaea tangerina]|nr:AAA family ATPase [Umezawaea tangerina]
MRFAEREKTFTSLARRKYTTSLTSALLNGSEAGSHEMVFAPGVTVVCGGNGAGKSSMLGAILRCLGDDQAESSTFARVPYWLAGITVKGSYHGEIWEAHYDCASATRSGTCPIPVVYIDASAETERILTLIRQDDNPGDLVEGIDSAPFFAEQVDLLSYVLRRSYTEVNVFEITAFSEDDTPTPFFTLESMGQKYDLTQMGRGELAAAYLIWRLGAVEKGSVVLLEEPESHLAVFSQQALAEVVVGIVVERDLTVVVSSHSPGFIHRLPLDHAIMLSASPVPLIRSGLTTSEVAQHLGLQPARDAILVVEDVVAAEFLASVLDHTAPDLASKVSIKFAESGESGVRRTVAELKASESSTAFAVLGVLDGDQRAEGAEFGYLMGDVAPEEVMRDLAAAWRADADPEWTPSFPGGRHALQLALERYDGLDHHDWVIELSRVLGGRRKFVDEMAQLCLRDPSVRDQAEQLVKWLRERVR